MVEAAQLDIFIPLQRSRRFPEWALLAREHQFDVSKPDGAHAFANWLRDSGRAPAGLSSEALTVLVAVMQEYMRAPSFSSTVG